MENDNQSSGFIAIYRSLQKHWIWQDPVKLKWWLDILLEANYKENKVLLGGQLIVCSRGQSVNSLVTWAKRWGVDKSKVRRFLKLLQNDQMIVLENVHKTTRLTVCNYDSYNGMRNKSETQTKHKRNGSETQMNPNNKDNKDNKGNKETNNSADAQKASRFVKPSKADIANYFSHLGLDDFGAMAQADKFYDYYESNGWKVGRNPMKDWKASCRNWKSNIKGEVAPSKLSILKLD